MPCFRSSVRFVSFALAFGWIAAFCPRAFADSRFSQTTVICSKYFTTGENRLSLDLSGPSQPILRLGDDAAVARAMSEESVPIAARDLVQQGRMSLALGAGGGARLLVDFFEPRAEDSALTLASVMGSLRALRELRPPAEPGVTSPRFHVAPIELVSRQARIPIAHPRLRFVSDVMSFDRRARDLFHQRLSQLESDARAATGVPVILISSAWREGFGFRSHLTGQIGPTGDLFEVSPSRVLVDLETYEMTIVNAFMRPARAGRVPPRERTVGRQFSVEYGARR